MKMPSLQATMQRRVLVNYRVDPDALASVLPRPFRPALVAGHGMAGICLIRLAAIRPLGFPSSMGLTSENAAHRIAVEWDTPDGPVTGVYVPRRDTSSRLAALAGGRLFPGPQHLARFRVEEAAGRYRIEVASRDRQNHIAVAAHLAPKVMADSVFNSLFDASVFFRGAPVAYTATSRPSVFEGMELCTAGWDIHPLGIEEIRSSYFQNPGRFPPGSVSLDSAFLMTDLATTWHARPALGAESVPAGDPPMAARQERMAPAC